MNHLVIVKEMRVWHCRWGLALCGLLAVVCAGCGDSSPKLYPATGTVTFEGKPVDGATVMFIPQQGSPSLGTTDAAGKYTMMTRGQPGAPAGTYSVTVTKSTGSTVAGGAAPSMPTGDGPPGEEEMKKMQEQMGNMMKAAAEQKDAQKALLPYKYSLPEGSQLSATVSAGAESVNDFALVP